jgi:hypothetical protein
VRLLVRLLLPLFSQRERLGEACPRIRRGGYRAWLGNQIINAPVSWHLRNSHYTNLQGL